MGQTAGSVPHNGLQDIDGNELGATVTLEANGVFNRDGNANNNAWTNAQDVPTAVMNTWYWRGNGTMSMTLAGLNPNLLYNVELFNAFDSWAGSPVCSGYQTGSR